MADADIAAENGDIDVVRKLLKTDVDVIVFNTVLWANVIASSDGRVSGSGPRIMWILHEMEITEHSVPSHEKFTTVWQSTIEQMRTTSRRWRGAPAI